jgi:flavin reductase (DIM6/NTAB) family NADH-FMN oxidoreductase RutF
MVMRESDSTQSLMELDTSLPVWDRFYWVAPLVLIGTIDPSGAHDFAPKHMALPMGWDNSFGFVCTPRHGTYSNIRREKAFTVSFPRPSQLVQTSLAAAPRCDEDEKPSLSALGAFSASSVKGVLLEGASAFLECELDRIVDGFGENSLIVGRIVAARVARNAARVQDGDDQALVHTSPMLAYLYPDRFATIEDSNSFPFPAGMKK